MRKNKRQKAFEWKHLMTCYNPAFNRPVKIKTGKRFKIVNFRKTVSEMKRSIKIFEPNFMYFSGVLYKKATKSFHIISINN